MSVLVPAIVDTNVVVAGLLTSDAASPTARILNGMIGGDFPFVVSVALLAEYRQVLARDRIRARHGLSMDEVDDILTAVAANAIVREPVASDEVAPEPGDQHLWDLLAAVPRAVLVTDDKRLIENAPSGVSVMLPGAFLDSAHVGVVFQEEA